MVLMERGRAIHADTFGGMKGETDTWVLRPSSGSVNINFINGLT